MIEKKPIESFLTKKGEIFNWNFSQEQLRIDQEWYIEKYEIISQALSGSVIIDCGCKDGCWMGEIHGVIPPNVYRLGIDPIDNKVLNLRGGSTSYNKIGGDPIFHFYKQYAIDDVDSKQYKTFYVFDEPGCNSLLNKTKDFNRNIIKEIEVEVRSLESILLEENLTNIHYLKCDCQGKDIQIVKSLKSLLDKTKYVQIECSFSKNHPMYDGQSYWRDDIKTMEELGFEPLYYVMYSSSLLPEGEVLFRNKRG